jgi:hypothetical protein
MTSTLPRGTLDSVASLLAANLYQGRTKLYDKRDDFNIPIVIFPFNVATFQQHLHMEYISLR